MKERTTFVCGQCGYQSVRWLGRCPNCGEWNTFAEEFQAKAPRGRSQGARLEPIAEVSLAEEPRTPTGIGELDRVLGGGVVPGSVTLLAGEPGVGKSTLLLTAAGRLAEKGKTVVYVSGEESAAQIKLRAKRLGILPEKLFIVSATEVTAVTSALRQSEAGFVIVDSVQTMYDPDVPTTPGSVTQVRESAAAFTSYAKEKGVPVCLVGHVTKEGSIAGPKVLEHLVDVVLSFEGEPRTNLRILRAVKNRFAATTEIGVFSMEEAGLREVPDAGSLFLQGLQRNQAGAVIFPGQEGSRTILVEVQALVTPTYFGIPKRSVTGLDFNRCGLILAVLEKKLHFNFGSTDVYLNVGGGIRAEEPACDLAVAAACVSSLKDVAPREQTVFFGEIALTGEIRPVRQVGARLKEASRFGMTAAVLPAENCGDAGSTSIRLIGVSTLKEAIAKGLPG